MSGVQSVHQWHKKRHRREWKYLYAFLILSFIPDHAKLMFRVRIDLMWIQLQAFLKVPNDLDPSKSKKNHQI
jgi:hypothetical protein